MDVTSRYENVLKRFEQLGEELSKPEVIRNQQLYRKLAREHGELVEAVQMIKRLGEVERRIVDDRDVLKSSGDVELVDDGDVSGQNGTVTDGCQPLIRFTPGNIALIDRGTCAFVNKVNNATAAGAVGDQTRAAFSAAAMSAMRSSADSMPMDRRTKERSRPMPFFSSSVMDRWLPV